MERYAKTTDIHPEMAALGQRLFEDERLSLNGEMSCRTCHLSRFSSADGLPNAVGVGGHGEGPERVYSGGRLVPRNTLPLWGRGGPGFDIFFWDGKVQAINGGIISQFGSDAPSDDALEVAVHLPVVEIREMMADSREVSRKFKNESISSAKQIYKDITKIFANDKSYARDFSSVFKISSDDIRFSHIAEALAAFIRKRFALRDTRFTRFLKGKNSLSHQETRGGLLFFGKGRCASCHIGSYFSDLKFHVIPFPQAGFGKNGFGVDYGRFNVTSDPEDLYAFRTPPLLNVKQTAPYGHSGWTFDLTKAIVAHFDPLRVVKTDEMGKFERHQLYKRLLAGADEISRVTFLNKNEIEQVEAFLGTLSFGEIE